MSGTSIETLVNVRAYSTRAALRRLGIKTIQDAIETLPFRYEDRTKIVPISALVFDQELVITGKIISISSRKSQRGILMIQVQIKDETGTITALWFNQRYLLKILRENDEITLYGVRKKIPSLRNPFVVKNIIAEPEICPIYRRTTGISQTTVRRVINRAIEQLEEIPNILPDNLSRRLAVADRELILRRAHRPQKFDDLPTAQRLLGAEELLVLALQAEQLRLERFKRRRPALKIDNAFLQEFVKTLPFALTDSQRKAAWEIIGDLRQNFPMNRLLYGEVGSGKTAVAAVIAAALLKQEKRVAIICPTLSLAEQQHRVLSSLLQPFGFEIGFSSSVEKKKHQAPIIIGTHALLKSGDNFDLVIIDEQHRFGVDQRQLLLKTNPNCDVLMMSATPIPRSFAQTLLKHLDITYLSQRPSHQQPVITTMFSEQTRFAIEKEIAERIKNNEPGYVVCPRISETNELVNTISDDQKSVRSEVKRLAKVFPNARIGEIHGQADSVKNQKTLERFGNGAIDVLVATTVIEIGIDNPNATWILIEDADYFGLSTLHQLRGRVGRGAKQSYCYVANNNRSDNSTKRLKAFFQITNGLELSEIDLELRGPGELTGLNQSGEIALKYASWSDKELFKIVFAEARKIMQDGFKSYPLLEKLVKINDE